MERRVERSVKDRTGIIGCSQLGQLLNVSHFGTPYDVYQDFMGLAKKEFSDEVKESMAMGTFFEEHIANYAAKKYNVRIRRSNKAYVHKKYKEFICHPDRIIYGKVDGKRIGVEIKLVQPFSPDWGEQDTDQVPDDYLLQSEGYIACKVCDEVWLFVMKGNRIYRYIITKNEVLIEAIEGAVEDFLKKVKDGVVFEPTDYEVVVKLNNRADLDKQIVATDELEKKIDIYRDYDNQAKKIKEKMDKIKGEIALYMKDNYRLTNGNGEYLVTFANTNSSSFDRKAFDEKYPGVYKKFTNTKETRRMTFAKR